VIARSEIGKKIYSCTRPALSLRYSLTCRPLPGPTATPVGRAVCRGASSDCRPPRAATPPFDEAPPPAAVRLGRRSTGCADRSRGPALLQRVPASVHRQPHALHHRSAARSPSLAGCPLFSVDRGDSPFPTLSP
jgi:hypothetical protein